MSKPSWWLRLTALALCACLPLGAAAQSGGDDEKKKKERSADEEIDELIGATYAETMTVTGTRTETSIINAPVSISVIGEKQLETSPADNYADLLRGVPGLNVVQTSARDINLQARGAASTLETSQLALIDGRSIYLDFFGFVAWDLAPVSFDEVKQVEVLRGPGSAVWGANALNGVVNLRTKSPREMEGGYFSVLGGERSTFASSIRWADAPTDTFSYKISASWFDQDAWDRYDALPGDDGRLGTEDDVPLPAGTDFINRGSQQPKFDVRFDWELGDGTLSWKTGWAGTSGLIHTGIGPFQIDTDTWLGYTEVNYAEPDWEVKFFANILDGSAPNLLNGLVFDFDQEVYALQYDRRTAIGEKNLLLYGIDVRVNEFDLSLAPRDDRRTEYGLYLEDQILFNEHVAWNVGARFDHFDTIGDTLSPRTSLILKPNERHAIRLAYNRAYRAPSHVNEFLETTIFNAADTPLGTLVFPSLAIGNEDLVEETIDAFEIGYTARIGDRATFTAAVYRNFTEDVIDFYVRSFYGSDNPPPILDPGSGMLIPWPFPPELVPPFTFPESFSYRNVGKVRDQGIELSLNMDFDEHWSGVFSYTWQDEPSVSDDSENAELLVLGTPPEHQFSAGVSWDYPRVFGSLSVTYTDEAFWTDVLDARYWGTTDDYLLVNASVAFRMPGERLEIVLAGTNLLDEDAQQHIYGDIIGRKLTGEVRVRW